MEGWSDEFTTLYLQVEVLFPMSTDSRTDRSWLVVFDRVGRMLGIDAQPLHCSPKLITIAFEELIYDRDTTPRNATISVYGELGDLIQ